MYAIVALITFYVTFHVSHSWTSMSAGGMSGVTYASGTIYNDNTMCPSNVNQGYVCDGRNFGDKYLNPSTVRSFCATHPGTSKQFGFGHGVTSSQTCGECAQIRVPRTDGTFNYMTVMMVDHFTWSMEVGTTEIAYLVEGTNWVVGDRANFEFRLADCYASFGDDGASPVNTPTLPPVTGGSCTTTTRCGSSWGNANGKCGDCCTTTCSNAGESCFADLAIAPCGNQNQPTPVPTERPVPTARPTERPGNGGGNSGECGVSNNWGTIKINPYWGSTSSQFFAMVSGKTISSFAIRGADQSNDEFQDCVKQNANFFQCVIRGGALTEPASVKLNGGDYYGINIIESMSGSSAQYPLSSCSGRFTFNDEDNQTGISWTILFAMCVLALLAIGIIVGICVYKKRMSKGKGYVSKEKGIDTIELRDNDGNNTTMPNGEMIEVNNDEVDEIEVEIEEAEMPMTVQ